MDIQYLQPGVTQEFEKKFPNAAAYLTRQSLMGEYKYLLKLGKLRNEWQDSRLADLREAWPNPVIQTRQAVLIARPDGEFNIDVWQNYAKIFSGGPLKDGLLPLQHYANVVWLEHEGPWTDEGDDHWRSERVIWRITDMGKYVGPKPEVSTP